MPRQYLNESLDVLERRTKAYWSRPGTLREIAHELSFRRTEASKRLAKKIEARVSELETATSPHQSDRPVAPNIDSSQGFETARIQSAPVEPRKTCPGCGATMVRRIGRAGPMLGREFWTCPLDPPCALDAASYEQSTPARVSRDFRAEPLMPGWQHVYYQSAALPATVVAVLHREGDGDGVVRCFAQWRLDLRGPLPLPPEQDLRNGLSVVEQLLLRGTSPLTPEFLESVLDQPGAEPDLDAARSALAAVIDSPTAPFVPRACESDDEYRMLEWLSARAASRGAHVYITPQVHLASLTPGVDAASLQRCDFLVTTLGGVPLVIEVDGPQHQATVEEDRARDDALAAAGVTVHRVPAGEVRQGRGPTLEAVARFMPFVESRPQDSGAAWCRVVRWTKWLHQCQIAILRAFQVGWLQPGRTWRVVVGLPRHLADDFFAELYVQAALEHLLEMVQRIGRLHGTPVPATKVECAVATDATVLQEGDLVVASHDWYDKIGRSTAPVCLISDALVPARIAPPRAAVTAIAAPEPNEEDARWFLNLIFRKPAFLEGQWTVVDRTLRGLDSIVLLPTGAGKSIAFQLASLLLPGRCIVVAPIISLIEDQIDNLRQYGIDRCVGVTSNLEREERDEALASFASGHHLFCYVAPERFQMPSFRDALRQLTVSNPVSAIVIDEAHCVSEWGHDFRTAYLNIGRIARDYCASAETVPPLVALTGTASRVVLKDVQRELGVADFDALITPTSFDRPEIRFGVLKCLSAEQPQRLRGILQSLPAHFAKSSADFFSPRGLGSACGLVFCPHVNGSFGATEVGQRLAALGVPVDVYTGKAPNGTAATRWAAHKQRAATRFKRNEILVLACTNAFGMGIDKPNVRYTVHLGLPRSIESFYQEAGRAGRDHHPARSFIVLSNDNPSRTSHLLGAATSLDEIRETVHGTTWEAADDITRALFFHIKTFDGEQAEWKRTADLLERLCPIESQHEVSVRWTGGEESRTTLERALHRLVVLGIVRDYTVNYSGRTLKVVVAGSSRDSIVSSFVDYVAAYQQKLVPIWSTQLRALQERDTLGFGKAASKLLVRFIYENVERTRRRALAIMFDAASASRDDVDLRRRILEYLQQSEWDERLEALRVAASWGLDVLALLVDDVVSPNDAAALRGAADRMLASYADSPPLLAVRGFAEALAEDASDQVISSNIRAAIDFATTSYDLGVGDTAAALAILANGVLARGRRVEAEVLVRASTTSVGASRELTRAMLALCQPQLATPLAEWLVSALVGEIRRTRLLEEHDHGR